MSVTRLQGLYYVVTGLWPLAHYDSFEAITGRKRDAWLVRTVGLIASGIGIVLVRHARSRAGREFGDVSALAFALGDLLAVQGGQSRLYLLDAVVECLIISRRHTAADRRG
jgi:hypothetical protein